MKSFVKPAFAGLMTCALLAGSGLDVTLVDDLNEAAEAIRSMT